MIELYENFSRECVDIRKDFNKQFISTSTSTSTSKFIELPKDVICYLGSLLDRKDLLSYFKVGKNFKHGTADNYHFWIARLLKDFNFSYDSIYDLSVVREHYRLL